MLIEPSATTAWARALAHHRSIDAAPFSAISSIGIRLEPRIGATSSISVVPKGNVSPAEASGSETAETNSTSKARQKFTVIGCTCTELIATKENVRRCTRPTQSQSNLSLDPISLLTGKLTGNSTEFRPLPRPTLLDSGDEFAGLVRNSLLVRIGKNFCGTVNLPEVNRGLPTYYMTADTGHLRHVKAVSHETRTDPCPAH